MTRHFYVRLDLAHNAQRMVQITRLDLREGSYVTIGMQGLYHRIRAKYLETQFLFCTTKSSILLKRVAYRHRKRLTTTEEAYIVILNCHKIEVRP